MDKIAWLHVSDFHIEAGADRFGQQTACKALVSDIRSRIGEHPPFSFALVTGDVAFSGKAAEYDQAREHLSVLADAAQLEPAQMYFVPGNHDVDRDLHDFAYVGATQVLTSQQEVDRALGNAERMADLVSRQEAYHSFAQSFTSGQARTPTADGLGYVALLRTKWIDIAIIGLNSAWLCGADGEEGSLIIGERQVLNALSILQEQDPHLTLAMVHHPVEVLHGWDQQSLRVRLLTPTHVLHRGHKHEAEVMSWPQRQCILVAAGSAHAGRFYPNSYNVVSLNLGGGTATIQTFDYLPDQRPFTARDPVSIDCHLGGDLEWSQRELADDIAAVVPESHKQSFYLAALIVGQKDEIPLVVGEEITFVSSDAASQIDPDQAGPAIEFLALRNLLRIRRPGETLQGRLTRHADVIRGYSERLSEYCDRDEGCLRRVTDLPLVRVQERAPEFGMPQTIALLDELASAEEWDLLEDQTSRHAAARDPELVRVATQYRVEALMHSDEQPKREQAASIAERLVADDSATARDHLLAAGSAEASGRVDRALDLTKRALDLWPGDEPLRTYARSLATRTGDIALRTLVREQGMGDRR